MKGLSSSGSCSEEESKNDTTPVVSEKEQNNLVMSAVRTFFAPEFLNRLDDIVIFRPLTTFHLSQILKQQLTDIESRLKDREVKLVLSKDAIKKILSEAYNPLYGARPLKRYLEKHIATELSRWIIGGKLMNKSIVEIVPFGDQFTFSITSSSDSMEE